MTHSEAQKPELEVPFVIMMLVKCCFKRPSDLYLPPCLMIVLVISVSKSHLVENHKNSQKMRV